MSYKTTNERLNPFTTGRLRYSELVHLKRYSIASEYAKGETLDIACGLGYGAVLLTELNSVRYFGADIDENAVQEARANYEHLGTFKLLEKQIGIPYSDGKFDTVCSLETIEHIEQDKQPVFYSELLRVLKPEGHLIISTPNRNFRSKISLKHMGWNNPYHKYEFSSEEFQRFLLENSYCEVQKIKTFYLGLPYNLTGAIHKHYFKKFFDKFPITFLRFLDVLDINLGFLFPKFCNSLVSILKKIEN